MTATTVNQLATDIVLWEAGQTVSLLAEYRVPPQPIGLPVWRADTALLKGCNQRPGADSHHVGFGDQWHEERLSRNA